MPLADPHGHQEDQVGDAEFDHGHTFRNGIDERQGDNDKEISHLTDRHGVGTVPHDGEDAEESDTDT